MISFSFSLTHTLSLSLPPSLSLHKRHLFSHHDLPFAGEVLRLEKQLLYACLVIYECSCKEEGERRRSL
jgi:hypothetical protein